ncbi:MAG TPA: hypothetical protein VGN80_17290 [Devosiaceae bacterium]|jgi:predicted transcriptional regulator|nr:hypothetical protein [Devosiaceae bacterium]
MAKPATLFDIEDRDAKMRAIDEARAEFEAGRGVPHDQVRAWLQDLAAGRRTPPPCE